MRRPVTLLSAALVVSLAGFLPASQAVSASSAPGAGAVKIQLEPQAIEAPDLPSAPGDNTTPACTTPEPTYKYAWIHCYTPADIGAAYGVNALHSEGDLGQGQTIVLVDAYGSPTAAADLQTFHDTFYPNLPKPDFTQSFPYGKPNFSDQCQPSNGGLSGPCAAEGWAGEATLDIEWAYAIAPRAHIVLLAVPPAETLGVQGFPNMFKAMQQAIETYPAGTVFSQSFGVTEESFGGAAQVQTARFDQVYQEAAAKGDTMLASAGDNGTTGAAKQQKEGQTYSFPTAGWPASSPYVTAVGGTQLQYGWTWDPTCDVPFTSAGYNPCYFNYTNGGNHEVVWNESWLPAATGGNASHVYQMPAYQNGVSSVIGTDARGVPDLSWNAAVNGGVLVYTSFFPSVNRTGWHVYGGTSAASPQVAALVALANQQQAANGDAPIGALNPLLYKVGSGAAFRDIVPTTQGTAASGVLDNNALWQYNADGSVSPGPVAGNPTLPGWDLTTGFGSPVAGAFVTAIRSAKNG